MASPSSASQQLLKLLQGNPHLAGLVRGLRINDVDALNQCFEGIPISEEGNGMQSPHVALERVIDIAVETHTQLASLTKVCGKLESLHIDHLCELLSLGQCSSLPSKSGALCRITLTSGAVTRYFHSVVKLLHKDSSLTLAPSLWDCHTGNRAVQVASSLALDSNHPPVYLKMLFISDASFEFLSPFLAQLRLRPGSLGLQVLAYDGLKALVDILVKSQLLKTLQHFFIALSPDASTTANQAGPEMDVLRELQRLKVAGPAGLQVTVSGPLMHRTAV